MSPLSWCNNCAKELHTLRGRAYHVCRVATSCHHSHICESCWFTNVTCFMIVYVENFMLPYLDFFKGSQIWTKTVFSQLELSFKTRYFSLCTYRNSNCSLPRWCTGCSEGFLLSRCVWLMLQSVSGFKHDKSLRISRHWALLRHRWSEPN